MIKAKYPALKFERQKSGMFQRDIAASVGITSNAYAQIENRIRTTTGKTAKAVCDVLGMEFDELFEISEPKAGEAHGENAHN